AETSGAITFVVPGLDESQAGAARGVAAASPSLPKGKEIHSVRVFSQRADGKDVSLSATPGEDVVELHLANGPVLCLHPESARELSLAQAGDGAARGGAEADAGEVKIPAQLAWRHIGPDGGTRGATRGGLGDALLSFVKVIREPAAGLVAEEVVKHVDDQVD